MRFIDLDDPALVSELFALGVLKVSVGAHAGPVWITVSRDIAERSLRSLRERVAHRFPGRSVLVSILSPRVRRSPRRAVSPSSRK